jgi:hypothetical protein
VDNYQLLNIAFIHDPPSALRCLQRGHAGAVHAVAHVQEAQPDGQTPGQRQEQRLQPPSHRTQGTMAQNREKRELILDSVC